MNNVFQKTRELGQALLESPEYQTLKKAEAEAMKDPKAAEHMGRYLECKSEIEGMLAGETPDTERLKHLSDDMDASQKALQEIESVRHMTEAKQAFSTLIDQVNQVLRFIVTGDMGGEEEGAGCSGHCGGCDGGCHLH